MILPIGQYAGATGDGAHEVRRGGVTERLNALSFAAWGLGHGPVDPVLAAGVVWTRNELVRYAGLAGLLDPAELVAGLVKRELLVEAPTTGSRALGFARRHRAVPLAIGLGNTPDAPAEYAIGHFDQALVSVDELRYEVWCWSTVYDTLWQVCQARSGAVPDGEAATPAGAGREPAQILAHFLAGVHQLVSTNALYLDVVAA